MRYTAFYRTLFLMAFLSVAIVSNDLCAQTAETETAASSASDTVRVSLLTCSAGTEIYSLFGHTAIRYEDPAADIDYVFNYGLFSFDTPNFIWRFMLGQTDYLLGINYYADFVRAYKASGRKVTAQYLNLSSEEKRRLYEALIENYRPENRTYRYNFLYDNCATRPRDKIEECLNGTLVYAPHATDSPVTYRQIIHQYSKDYAWDTFGMDFCLGSRADLPIDNRQEMFAPFYLAAHFAAARIIPHDASHPEYNIVSHTIDLLPETAPSVEPSVVTPLLLFVLLLIVGAGATVYDVRRHRLLWGLDAILFAVAGLAGCLLTFLVFFSEHPAVSSNYLLWVFHPLHLFAVPWMIVAERKSRLCAYHYINVLLILSFLLFIPFSPQYINPAIVPIVLCLLIRSAANIIITYQRKRR
ncbi:MAG: DUF4105 domain-containing protein [Prevotellaceae bacterium]|jgi:hypothetical protein|nr:DUF4105 domain-containing protein [Prevotellaceae bacterium]